MNVNKAYQPPKVEVCRLASMGTILWASWDKPHPGGAPKRRTEVF